MTDDEYVYVPSDDPETIAREAAEHLRAEQLRTQRPPSRREKQEQLEKERAQFAAAEMLQKEQEHRIKEEHRLREEHRIKDLEKQFAAKAKEVEEERLRCAAERQKLEMDRAALDRDRADLQREKLLLQAELRGFAEEKARSEAEKSQRLERAVGIPELESPWTRQNTSSDATSPKTGKKQPPLETPASFRKPAGNTQSSGTTAGNRGNPNAQESTPELIQTQSQQPSPESARAPDKPSLKMKKPPDVLGALFRKALESDTDSAKGEGF